MLMSSISGAGVETAEGGGSACVTGDVTRRILRVARALAKAETATERRTRGRTADADCTAACAETELVSWTARFRNPWWRTRGGIVSSRVVLGLEHSERA